MVEDTVHYSGPSLQLLASYSHSFLIDTGKHAPQGQTVANTIVFKSITASQMKVKFVLFGR